MSIYIDTVNLQMCSETYVIKYIKNMYSAANFLLCRYIYIYIYIYITYVMKYMKNSDSATNFHSVYMRIYSEKHVNIDTEHLHTRCEKHVEVEMVYMHVCIHTCVQTKYECFE